MADSALSVGINITRMLISGVLDAFAISSELSAISYWEEDVSVLIPPDRL